MYGIINAGVHFFPDLCSCVMRTSPFFFTSLLSPRQSWHERCIGSYFPIQCGQRETEEHHWHRMSSFHHSGMKRESLLITFAISVKVFWTHFETNWYNKIFSRCFNSLGFRTLLTYQLDPIYRYRKARNLKHVYPEKMSLFVVSSHKGERSQDSLLLSQLTFATIIS